MKALRVSAILIGVLVMLGYAVSLGIYAVASTRGAVASQPRDADEPIGARRDHRDECHERMLDADVESKGHVTWGGRDTAAGQKVLRVAVCNRALDSHVERCFGAELGHRLDAVCRDRAG